MTLASKANEQVLQNDIINQMIVNGWQLGTPAGYNRELALYEEDVLGFVQDTQDEQWQKYCKLYPQNPEKYPLEKVASQLNKADPNAADRDLRIFVCGPDAGDSLTIFSNIPVTVFNHGEVLNE